MAGIGAFLAADKEIIRLFEIQFTFTNVCKVITHDLCKRCFETLGYVTDYARIKGKTLGECKCLQNGLKERGFDIGTTTSCVTPVYLTVVFRKQWPW